MFLSVINQPRQAMEFELLDTATCEITFDSPAGEQQSAVQCDQLVKDCDASLHQSLIY